MTTSDEMMAQMVGRRVKVVPWGNKIGNAEGTVTKWCPWNRPWPVVIVQMDTICGGVVWSMPETLLRSLDGRELPCWRSYRAVVDEEWVGGLRKILRDHIREMGIPWPGLEAGKALVGNAVLTALVSHGLDRHAELQSALADVGVK